MAIVDRLSERVRAIEPSATMALAQKARDLRAAGRPVISLTAGEPDMDTPAPIVARAHQAMQEGLTHYTGAGGLPELRASLVGMLAREGVELEGEDAVFPTPGAKQAVFYAVMGLVNPGDAVLVPEPAWVSYHQILGLAGARIVPVALDPDEDFRLDPERLLAAGREAGDVRMIVLNAPSNPTGRVLSPEELEGLVRVAEELDCLVLSDEIYGRLVYPGGPEFRRLASVSGLRDRVVTVDGFSKAWSMTGWRLGWLAGPRDLILGIRKLQMHTATCPATFVQSAGVTAIEQCDAHVQGFLETFDRRRKLVEERFGALPGVRVPRIQGAFYAFLDAREVDADDAALCARWLEEAEVAMVPGSAFGAAGAGFLRMSFAAPDEDLELAAERLKGWLSR